MKYVEVASWFVQIAAGIIGIVAVISGARGNIQAKYWLPIVIVAGIITFGFIFWRIKRRGKRERLPQDIIPVTKDISAEDFSKGVDLLTQKITMKYVPDLIIIMSSGGATVGGILSKHLNIPAVMVVRATPILQETSPEKSVIVVFPSAELIKDKKILLVDDIIRSGSTLKSCFEKTNAASPSQIKSAVLLLAGEHPPELLDFYVYRAMRPDLRMFYDYHRTKH